MYALVDQRNNKTLAVLDLETARLSQVGNWQQIDQQKGYALLAEWRRLQQRHPRWLAVVKNN